MKSPRALAISNMVLKDFTMGSKVSGNGRFTVTNEKSKTGTCALCRAMAGRHNIKGAKTPPYHPNCRCNIS